MTSHACERLILGMLSHELLTQRDDRCGMCEHSTYEYEYMPNYKCVVSVSRHMVFVCVTAYGVLCSVYIRIE